MMNLITTFPAHDHDTERFDEALRRAMDDQLARFTATMETTLHTLLPTLPPEAAAVLHREYRRWRRMDDWRLINTADPCGT